MFFFLNIQFDACIGLMTRCCEDSKEQNWDPIYYYVADELYT